MSLGTRRRMQRRRRSRRGLWRRTQRWQRWRPNWRRLRGRRGFSGASRCVRWPIDDGGGAATGEPAKARPAGLALARRSPGAGNAQQGQCPGMMCSPRLSPCEPEGPRRAIYCSTATDSTYTRRYGLTGAPVRRARTDTRTSPSGLTLQLIDRRLLAIDVLALRLDSLQLRPRLHHRAERMVVAQRQELTQELLPPCAGAVLLEERV